MTSRVPSRTVIVALGVVVNAWSLVAFGQDPVLPDAKIWFSAVDKTSETIAVAQHLLGRIGVLSADQQVRWTETESQNEWGVDLLPGKSQIVVWGSALIPPEGGHGVRVTRLRHYSLGSLRLRRTVDLPASDHICWLNADWLALWPHIESEEEPDPGRVEFWRDDGRDVRKVFSYQPENGVAWVACGCDEHTVLVNTTAKRPDSKPGVVSELVLLDLESRAVLKRAPANVYGPLVLSQGAHYAAIGSGAQVEVYSVPDLVLHGSFRPGRQELVAGLHLAVSDDGNLVGWGRERVEVWDLRTGQAKLLDQSLEKISTADQDLRPFTDGKVSPEEPKWHDFTAWMQVDFCTCQLQFINNDSKLLALNRIGQLREWDTTDWKLVIDRQLVHPSLHYEALENFTKAQRAPPELPAASSKGQSNHGD